MMQNSEPKAAKILITSLISLLTLQAEALNCVNITGFNLQCPDLSSSVSCLEIGPMRNVATPYDLLCDGVSDCNTTSPPVDERNAAATPGLICGELIIIYELI